MLCTSGFVYDVMSSYHWARMKHDVMFRRVRQVAVPVRQLQCLVELVHHNAAPGVQSAIYDHLVVGKLTIPVAVYRYKDVRSLAPDEFDINIFLLGKYVCVLYFVFLLCHIHYVIRRRRRRHHTN